MYAWRRATVPTEFLVAPAYAVGEQIEMRVWVVTGGAGFIGANFVRHILDENTEDRVVVLDALTYAGHLESLAGCEASGRFEFLRGDICEPGLVASVLRRTSPAVVVHLAAESHVDRSIHGPAPFLRTNVEGTFRVLDAMKELPTGRLVVVSTDEVYGSLGPTGRFSETSPIQPSSPYAASKASADLLAIAYHHTYGLDVVVTRCSNNYGPYQMPEKLIPLMILQALSGEPLPVYGDGQNIRDWIHVSDHCAGIIRCAERGRIGQIYHFGGDAERSNLNVVHRILKKLGKPESLVRFVKDRPGHDRRYAMAFDRARHELGFAPRTRFEEGLDATVEWYASQREWCTAVQNESHRDHLLRNYEALRVGTP
jgi:dTDP-glucose 4,6-dehydratase